MTQRQRFASMSTSVLLVASLWLLGCATQLAPAFDERIVDGLTRANADAMTLFAAFSAGAPTSRFAEYRDRYDQLIGAVDALEMQIAARPTPELPAGLSAPLAQRAVDASGPPVEPVQGMSRTIRMMRDTHAASGLTAAEVDGLRRQWTIYADQALTYEAYLNR